MLFIWAPGAISMQGKWPHYGVQVSPGPPLGCSNGPRQPFKDFPSLRLNFFIYPMEELESIFDIFPSSSNIPKVCDYLGFHVSGQDLDPIQLSCVAIKL